MTVADTQALLIVLDASTKRLSEYPSHTTEFAAGWFDAVELSRLAIETMSTVWELLPHKHNDMFERLGNRLFAQHDMVEHLSSIDRVGKDYGNGFREFCQVAATELHRAYQS